MERIIKYPRTPHLVGSGIQFGDEDLSQVPFSEILGKNIVIEEKIDGANCGISFCNGELLLQSRGHYLTGGNRERHYDLLKKFGAQNYEMLYSILGERYVMYGEWMYAKHRVYYDLLPDYFLEFDIFDKENQVFLDTSTRKAMLEGSNIASVPVLGQGAYKNRNEILKHIAKSSYISENAVNCLENECTRLGLDFTQIRRESELSGFMEGLYIKVEQDAIVKFRVKFVRSDYKQVQTSENWFEKKIIPNKLK